MSKKNVFGITEFYPTAPNGVTQIINNPNVMGGWEYFSTEWGRNVIDEFPPNDNIFLHDRFMHFSKVDSSYCIVRGDGRLTIGTENPKSMRLRIYDDDNLNAGISNALNVGRGFRWTQNIEFTFYFNKILNSETQKSPLDGSIEVHLGSDHHFGASETAGLCPFNAHEYMLVIQNDGRMYLGGEPYHGSRRDPKPDGVMDIDFWDNQFNGIPLNTLIGIKLIKRVVDTKNIFLEVYRDMTEGFNGGTWNKLFEFKHERDNWYNESMDIPYEVSLDNIDQCVVPPPNFVDDPHANAASGGGMCYLRITPVKELDLKWISCRDIYPDLRPPVTTEDELEEGGDAGDSDTTGY